MVNFDYALVLDFYSPVDRVGLDEKKLIETIKFPIVYNKFYIRKGFEISDIVLGTTPVRNINMSARYINIQNIFEEVLWNHPEYIHISIGHGKEMIDIYSSSDNTILRTPNNSQKETLLIDEKERSLKYRLIPIKPRADGYKPAINIRIEKNS